jgi:hypothetical protein
VDIALVRQSRVEVARAIGVVKVWSMTIDVTLSPDSKRHRRGLPRIVWGVAVASVVVAAIVWFDVGRSSGVSVQATVADCSRAIAPQNSTGTVMAVPTVVGLGSAASLATFDLNGWHWCFSGLGTGSGGITTSQMKEPVDVPVAVLDGVGVTAPAILLLVHRNARTARVIVDTAWSLSSVVANGAGFEVLRVPMTRWPFSHGPWSRTPIVIGRIQGFDGRGEVTYSEPFTWCAGSINTFPGQGC